MNVGQCVECGTVYMIIIVDCITSMFLWWCEIIMHI